jgi:hypothetical protein
LGPQTCSWLCCLLPLWWSRSLALCLLDTFLNGLLGWFGHNSFI